MESVFIEVTASPLVLLNIQNFLTKDSSFHKTNFYDRLWKSDYSIAVASGYFELQKKNI